MVEELRSLVAAAREALCAHFEGRRPRLSPPIRPSAPVFVTLRIGGELRGCMGELSARHDDLVAETMDRALAAALSDPRFEPLREEELRLCDLEVSVLGPMEAVSSRDELDPLRYGIAVSDDTGRSAVLLPGIEGVVVAERQIEIARRKAGIESGVEIRIRRFEVTKIREPGSLSG